MSRAGNQPLARGIVALRIALADTPAPRDVIDVLHVVDHAMASGRPRVELNRRLAKLRQARPGLFRRVSGWLKSTAVQRTAQRTGTFWAWLIWRRACWMLCNGAKAHAAFGMDRPGRARHSGFSRYEDAAIYAEFLHNVRGIPSEKAAGIAMEAVQSVSGLDRWTLHQHRATVRNNAPSPDDLSRQAEFIERKYGIS